MIQHPNLLFEKEFMNFSERSFQTTTKVVCVFFFSVFQLLSVFFCFVLFFLIFCLVVCFVSFAWVQTKVKEFNVNCDG